MASLRASLAAFLSCVVLPGCTSEPASSSAAQPASPTIEQRNGRCFTPAEVNGFSGAKDRNAVVSVGANRYYLLELGGGCPDINWATGVAIRSTAGGPFICEGYDAELIVPEPTTGPQVCPVTKVRAITKEQYFADQKPG